MARTLSEPIIAFLPCRRGSERVPRKNIRPFGQAERGLIQIKLAQLLACPAIDSVYLSTNDEEIISFAETIPASKLNIHRRDENLSSSSTSTDALVGHARELISSGHILWTHVTSPFVTAQHYSEIVTAYYRGLVNGYDSLMTTTPLQSFLWGATGPVNYDRSVEKWPRTQTLTPLHEVNSAAFLAPVEVYTRYQDRIGKRPVLHPLDRLVAHDIDWEADFIIAEQLLLSKLVTI